MDRYSFKAKRLDNGEWETGFYVKCRGHHYILPVYDDGHGYDERYAEWVEIVPETVCQYTGLQDKNVQKIWENDIVRTSKYGKDDGKGHNFAGFDAFSVRWNDGGFALFSKWRRFNLRSDLNEYEIIGNIFDNPDLLTRQNRNLND